MKKTDSVLLGFVLKSVFLSIVFVAFLTAVFTKLTMMFDLDISYCSYFGYVVLFIASFATAFLTTINFKNSLVLMCILSNIPAIILSVINSIINKSFFQLVICAVIIIVGSLLSAIINAKRTRKFKV
ncbi:hypothetical protein [uncultured Eubacterium sp.]|uniref:hypothetical protein n=1 Tax=uncultured Eubacterium sp. TaxID=165185 RepID=UPI002628EF4E|nr:hypothetical protein [uncultured Eubacterium sp.]